MLNKVKGLLKNKGALMALGAGAVIGMAITTFFPSIHSQLVSEKDKALHG